MKKILSILLVVALFGVAIPRVSMAIAEDYGSGQPETSTPFTAAITAGTVATVISATTSKAINVRSIVMTNTASGFIRLYSKDSSVGANLIGTFNVIANTPLALTQEHLRAGICTRVGEALVVDATTGTVSLQVDSRLDAKSPKQ